MDDADPYRYLIDIIVAKVSNCTPYFLSASALLNFGNSRELAIRI